MKFTLILISLALLVATTCAATVRVVRPDGQGTLPNIQAAVDASTDGDQIWLIAGVFTGPGNRDIVIGPRNILIRSFDDDPAVCIIDCEGSESAPHRAFWLNDSVAQITAIQSITMRGGYAESGGGGAMLISGHASGYIVNCVFENNASGMTDWHAGGAVYVNYGGTPVFNGCVFRGNQAFAGGALTTNHGGRVTFNDCRFIGNRAIRGGAIYGITTEKNGCLFAGNEAQETGGAIWHNSSGLDYYESCTFDGNRAPAGGAIFINSNYGGPVEMIDTIISNCPEGEAIACNASVPITFSCCNFYGNAGGDWTEPFADQVDLNGNFSANPCYCDAAGEDFYLCADSYALEGNHPWGCDQLVGAYGLGCGVCGCTGPVDVQGMSFGALKSLYR